MADTNYWLALRLGLAAWLAFAAATALGIEHAFWAAMPVWVIAQPWRGVTLERALWRLFGTVVGGAIGLGLLAMSPGPLITAIGMALLLACCAALMHLRQRVASYFPLMTAITIAVVVIPAMMDPSDGLHLALDRLLCTAIGAVAATFVVGMFTPKADTAGFRSEGAALVHQFQNAAKLILTASPELSDAATSKAIHTGAELEGKARLIAAGSQDGRRRKIALDGILSGGLALLEAASAAAENEPDRKRAIGILEGDHLTPPAPSALSRLALACETLRRANIELQSVAPSGRSLSQIAPPSNPALAKRAAVIAAVASLVGSMMIVATNSFAAELTAFSMAIFSLVIGSMPMPQAMAKKLGTGVVIGAAAGMAYRIGLQPYIGDWAALVVSVIPFIAIGALARTNPRSAPYALDANMCFMLASQAGAAAAPPSTVLVSGIAMIVGTLLMVGWYMSLPRPGPHLINETKTLMLRDLRALSQRAAGNADLGWQSLWGRRLVTLAIELDKAGETLPRALLTFATKGHEMLNPRRST